MDIFSLFVPEISLPEAGIKTENGSLPEPDQDFAPILEEATFLFTPVEEEELPSVMVSLEEELPADTPEVLLNIPYEVPDQPEAAAVELTEHTIPTILYDKMAAQTEERRSVSSELDLEEEGLWNPKSSPISFESSQPMTGLPEQEPVALLVADLETSKELLADQSPQSSFFAEEEIGPLLPELPHKEESNLEERESTASPPICLVSPVVAAPSDQKKVAETLSPSTLNIQEGPRPLVESQAAHTEVLTPPVQSSEQEVSVPLTEVPLINETDTTGVDKHPRPELVQRSLPAPLHSPQWQGQLQESVLYFMTKNIQKAQIHLNPPELGPIDISVKIDKSQDLTVLFSSQYALTKEAIEDALPKLKTVLTTEGFKNCHCEVELAQGDSYQSYFESSVDQQSQEQRQKRGYLVGNPVVSDDEILTNPVQATHVGLIDLYG